MGLDHGGQQRFHNIALSAILSRVGTWANVLEALLHPLSSDTVGDIKDSQDAVLMLARVGLDEGAYPTMIDEGKSGDVV